MKRLTYVLTTVLVVFLLAGSTVDAQGRMGRGGKRGFGRGFRGQGKAFMVNKLNLTAEQQTKVNDLNYKLDQTRIEVNAQIQSKQLELQKLINDGSINSNAVMSLTKDISTLKSGLREKCVTNWLSIYELLDDTQKLIWKDCMPGNRAGFGRRGQGRGFNNGCYPQRGFGRFGQFAPPVPIDEVNDTEK